MRLSNCALRKVVHHMIQIKYADFPQNPVTREQQLSPLSQAVSACGCSAASGTDLSATSTFLEQDLIWIMHERHARALRWADHAPERCIKT